MWILTAFIIGAILAVRLLPYPYRSIVDGGVVVGLGWGLTSVLVFLVKTLAGSPPSIPLDIPLPHDSQK